LRSQDPNVPHRLGGAHSPRRALFRTTSAETELPSFFGQTLKLNVPSASTTTTTTTATTTFLNNNNNNQQKPLIVESPFPIQISKPFFTGNQ